MNPKTGQWLKGDLDTLLQLPHEDSTMPTQFITLKDGIRIEAEVTDTRVAAKGFR